ncbi:MAG: phosphate signaling complex protein PhoU [Bdellovibrionales bacterium]|nr:phosphate signaling complex protein PhoU [Bdellovibrionales bacterium]
MTVHLLQALTELRSKLLTLSSETEAQLVAAIDALIKRDMVLAQRVIAGDSTIDELEVELEEDCLKILALYQPVAQDLRFIVTALKINNDLERIGDLAVNIAHRAIKLAEYPELQNEAFANIEQMATKAKAMLRNCIIAFVDRSVDVAQRILVDDQEINRLHVANFDAIERLLVSDPPLAKMYIAILSVSRYLERIGDQAKNIAEDVIYLIDGRIVRHGASFVDES